MAYRIAYVPKPIGADIPLIGENFAKIGRIIDIWYNPCTPTPTMWVLAFWQAIPTAFISIVKPQLIDINIHHRRGKPRKGKKYKFTVSDLFRDALIEIPVPRWVPFRIWEKSQLIGFYLMLADVSEDLAVNWMSLAYKANGCTVPFLEYLTAYNDKTLQGGPSGGGAGLITWQTRAANRIGWQGDTARILFPGRYRIGWSVTFDGHDVPGAAETPSTTYCTVDNVPTQVGETSIDQNNNVVASGSFILNQDGGGVVPTVRIIAEWPHGTGHCWVSGDLEISNDNNTSLEPDP